MSIQKMVEENTMKLTGKRMIIVRHQMRWIVRNRIAHFDVNGKVAMSKSSKKKHVVMLWRQNGWVIHVWHYISKHRVYIFMTVPSRKPRRKKYLTILRTTSNSQMPSIAFAVFSAPLSTYTYSVPVFVASCIISFRNFTSVLNKQCTNRFPTALILRNVRIIVEFRPWLSTPCRSCRSFQSADFLHP